MEQSVAAVGERNAVLGFRALGVETYPVASVEEAKQTVRSLAQRECAVIFLTETLAKDMEETLARYGDALRPAIVLIPGQEGSLGLGRERLQKEIRRAIGTQL